MKNKYYYEIYTKNPEKIKVGLCIARTKQESKTAIQRYYGKHFDQFIQHYSTNMTGNDFRGDYDIIQGDIS